MHKKRKISICLFGSYDPTILNTKALIRGLEELRSMCTVTHLNATVPKSVIYNPEHLTKGAALKRAYYRLLAAAKLLVFWPKVLRHDVVLILPFGLFDLVYGFFFRYLFGKTVIYVPLNSLYDLLVYASHRDQASLFAKIIFYVERILYKVPHRVVFNTEDEATYHKQLLRLPNLQTLVVPLGADSTLFKPASKHKPGEQLQVLFYGEYNTAHGVDIIAKAAKRLRCYEAISFTLLGDGRTRPPVERYVHRNNLTNITFLGWVEPEALVGHIHQADLVLGMFNGADGTMQRVIPNKVYQGLATKKCIITGFNRSLSQVLTDKKEIYLIKPSSDKALADAILYLSEHPGEITKIATAGYAKYRAAFANKPVAEKLLTEIKALQDKPTKGLAFSHN